VSIGVLIDRDLTAEPILMTTKRVFFLKLFCSRDGRVCDKWLRFAPKSGRKKYGAIPMICNKLDEGVEGSCMGLS
jgi:hypothetical protein